MKKGFTLIELLAVIVILAIIALIAVPIILNIIKDSEEESNKRSIEMYAKALENSIAKYQLSGKKLEVSKLETIDGRNFSNIDDLKVDYEGNVVCHIIDVYEDGNIYLDDCEVNRKTIKYSYGTKRIPEPVSFSTDSWETIAKAVREGNTSMYNVGDTKEIKLEGFTNEEPDSNGLYTLRIANKSSSDKVCTEKGNSETACGFVIEFVDIITEYVVSTNVGGYPQSSTYKFVNKNIYNSLPTDLRNIMKDTIVISSHGSEDTENFKTTDKVYLLTAAEVFGVDSDGRDSSVEQTRQLDYYKNQGVTTSSCLKATKKYKGNNYFWWLRSSEFGSDAYYHFVSSDGSLSNGANRYEGISVAFRIG